MTDTQPDVIRRMSVDTQCDVCGEEGLHNADCPVVAASRTLRLEVALLDSEERAQKAEGLVVQLREALGCRVCGNRIEFYDSPSGSWWSHLEHPADGHDALPSLLGEEKSG